MITLPTFAQIYQTDLANLNGEFGASISLLKKVALRAYAASHAGRMWLYYKAIAVLQKNIWPDTADSVDNGGTLERFGKIKLGRYRDPAVAGIYNLQVTGSIAAVIPGQTTFKSDDTSESPGYLFILDNAFILGATTDTISLRALTPGTIAKLAVGDTLTATKPLVLINKSAEVTAITTQPLDEESIEEYRTAVLNSFRLEAQGGAVGDYRIWSADVQGVKKVYPYAKPGENLGVNVYVEATVANSTDGKGTPPALMLTDVGNAIELNPDTSLPIDERIRRPIGTKVYPLAIIPKNIDVEINGFAGVTAAQQTLINTALSSAIANIRPYIAGADDLATKNDIIDTNKLNAYIIAAVPGAGYASVTLKVAGVIVPTYTFLYGEIPYYNSVAYL